MAMDASYRPHIRAGRSLDHGEDAADGISDALWPLVSCRPA
jgi:hypothetical protein